MWAAVCRGQTAKGNIDVGDGSATQSVLPFTCNVDTKVFKTIADCVNFTPTLPVTGTLPGEITSNIPEEITSLPWDPTNFSGIVKLGKGLNGATSCASVTPPTIPNCYVADVPIIIGSHMSLVGVGQIAKGNFFTGTAIVPGSSFPAPLGAPVFTSTDIACNGTGSFTNVVVAVVEVNELNTFSGSMLKVPGLSAMTEVSKTCTGGASSLTITAPAALGTPPFDAKDYRVFLSNTGILGSETLQAPNLSLGMTCTAPPSTDPDPNYGCKLGGTATITAIQTNGDFPNLVDLSNPLVVEIGPPVGTLTPPPPNVQNEGFGSVLANLTLALPTSAGTNNPNVAFWNPSNQENSGLSFVGFSGVTANTSPMEAGAWAYIGNHAPNSFVSRVQTSTDPANSGTFYGMILDGRQGFGSALGTARVVSDSTFTPGRAKNGTATIPEGILIMGNKAITQFSQVHVEVPSTTGSGSAFEIDSGASVSIVGPTQLAATGSPLIHLAASGAAVMVKNILGPSSTQTAVQDDVNQVSVLGPFVANYSSSLQAGTLQVLKSFTLPNQNPNLIYAGPASGAAAAPAFRALVPADLPTGTVTTSGSPAAHQVAVFSGATSVTGTASDSTTTHALFATSGDPAFRALAASDLPTGGTVQMLGAGQAGVMSATNSVYVPWLGGAFNTAPTGMSALAPSTGSIAGLFVGVNSPYGISLTVTFTVASCTPSGAKPCTSPADSNLACQITGMLVTQCSQTLTTGAPLVTQGDEVFLHVTVPAGSTIPNRTVFMSYRLTGVQ